MEKGESCWLWRGSVSNNGYGKFFDGTNSTAHRFSFFLHFGIKPEAVCHKCDVKLCVNPGHLFAGTQLENIIDRDRKGRTFRGKRETPIKTYPRWAERFPETVRGERNPRAKLTENDVKEIRKRYSGKYGQLSELGREFGVCHTAIRDIVKMKRWSHI